MGMVSVLPGSRPAECRERVTVAELLQGRLVLKATQRLRAEVALKLPPAQGEAASLPACTTVPARGSAKSRLGALTATGRGTA
jgi:hypothetical protein